MTFELSTLFISGFSYLLMLFGSAYLAERGIIPERWVRHPVTYVLSLGVYAGAFSFFGVVELAHQTGPGYLTYYLGISGAFLIAPVFLKRILTISRRHQLSSLADIFAFRYNSQRLGMVVTMAMLVALLPLLALQIQVVADMVSLLTGHTSQWYWAFSFCAVVALFSVGFGARHASTKDKNEGLVTAIALESLLKLMAMCILGGFAVFGVFDGPGDIQNWLEQNPQYFKELYQPLGAGPSRSLLLVFFASAVVMPHMYHMTFTENIHPNTLEAASWGFPLYLFIMSLAIPPILWAGFALNVDTPPEYFSLGIGLISGSPSIAMVTFIGGLAAASGLIIVTTIALSAMVTNHLILPNYQPKTSNFYRWLLNARRISILAIILAAFLFYVLAPSQETLSHEALISFTATLQFIPALVGVMYWPSANRLGVLAGLFSGLGVWATTLLLPFLAGTEQAFSFTIELPLIADFFSQSSNAWHLTAVASLTVNFLVFALVSALTQTSREEVEAAKACSTEFLRRGNQHQLNLQNPEEFVSKLSLALGEKTSASEVNKALKELDIKPGESRPYQLIRLRNRLLANLSGLLGPSVAKDITNRYLEVNSTSPAMQQIHYIEGSLPAEGPQLTGLTADINRLRHYHRQVLQKLPLGACSLGDNLDIYMWNHALEEVTGLSADAVVGTRLPDLPRPWGKLFVDFVNDEANHLHKYNVELNDSHRWVNLHKSLVEEPNAPDTNSLVILVEDLTDTQMLEQELIHSERLASIGRLAAGVAHEIGNPITGIACIAQNLEAESENPDIQEMSEQILQQTQRVSRILQTLMNFAHTGGKAQQHSHQPVLIHSCVDEAIQLLKLSQKAKEIHFDNQVESGIYVTGDTQRLLQVFVNLLSNARDASPVQSEIKIYSQTNEQSVLLYVLDNGSGIPKQAIERVFEPFFTTKDPGKGTGLGLAMVYSIVEEHFGHIDIESPANPNAPMTCQGTKITITLPRFNQRDDDHGVIHTRQRADA